MVSRIRTKSNGTYIKHKITFGVRREHAERAQLSVVRDAVRGAKAQRRVVALHHDRTSPCVLRRAGVRFQKRPHRLHQKRRRFV